MEDGLALLLVETTELDDESVLLLDAALELLEGELARALVELEGLIDEDEAELHCPKPDWQPVPQ